MPGCGECSVPVGQYGIATENDIIEFMESGRPERPRRPTGQHRHSLCPRDLGVVSLVDLESPGVYIRSFEVTFYQFTNSEYPRQRNTVHTYRILIAAPWSAEACQHLPCIAGNRQDSFARGRIAPS